MDRLPKHAEEILKKHELVWEGLWYCSIYCHDDNGEPVYVAKSDREIASILAEEYKLSTNYSEDLDLWSIGKSPLYKILSYGDDPTALILEAVRKINETN